MKRSTPFVLSLRQATTVARITVFVAALSLPSAGALSAILVACCPLIPGKASMYLTRRNRLSVNTRNQKRKNFSR